jgi:dihydrodipicolinate synthase/N-acetylneuraminate lyase
MLKAISFRCFSGDKTMAQFQINGVVPIIPTPFLQDGSIDFSSLKNLLDFAVSAEVSAVCLPAYASEFYKLTDFERRDVVLHAIGMMDGRLPIIGQVNHVSPAYVAETARELEQGGVSAISVAVPRLFSLPDRDLLRYFDRILSSIGVPLLIQDFNPGGVTVSLDFIQTLRRQHQHFRYLKLEEPLMSERVRAIIDGTNGELGVLEGWGGVYMLELFEAGIIGIMPGLAVADVLRFVWNLLRQGDQDGAYSAFIGVLPQINYSLQNVEFFPHAEKALLVARGVLPKAFVRDLTLTVGERDRAHIDFLNRKVLEWLDHLGLAKSPNMHEAVTSLRPTDHKGGK